MQAIQFTQPNQIEFIDLPEPGELAADEAIVRVHAVGICGTDISGYLGKMPFFKYPRIPGHELGVEVVCLGSEVKSIKVGQMCAVEPYLNNPSSDASIRGFQNCCNDLLVLGVHIDGGMRPYFKLPARKLHPANDLSYEQLALVETLAIGRHAVSRGQATSGEHVLVIGAGPIGLSVIEFLKLQGCQITVMDINRKRLEFCLNTLLVDHIIEYRGDQQELVEMNQITDRRLYRLVLDATGHSGSMSHCLEYASHAGRVVFVGITTQEIHFFQQLMHRKELTLLASRNAYPEDFTFIIEKIAAGKINTKPWITHHVQFKDVPREFPKFTQVETGAIKAIIHLI